VTADRSAEEPRSGLTADRSDRQLPELGTACLHHADCVGLGAARAGITDAIPFANFDQFPAEHFQGFSTQLDRLQARAAAIAHQQHQGARLITHARRPPGPAVADRGRRLSWLNGNPSESALFSRF
jgi:hypothetical protein